MSKTQKTLVFIFLAILLLPWGYRLANKLMDRCVFPQLERGQ